MAARNSGASKKKDNIFQRFLQACLRFFHIFFEFQRQLLRSLLGAVRGRRAAQSVAGAGPNKSKIKNGYQKVVKDVVKWSPGKFPKNGTSPTKQVGKMNLNITEDFESGEGGRKMPSPSENDRLLEWTDSNGRQYRMDPSHKKIDVVKIFGETKKYEEITFLTQENISSNNNSFNGNKNMRDPAHPLVPSKLRIKRVMLTRPSDDTMPFTNLKLSNYEGINTEYLELLVKQGQKDSTLGSEETTTNKLQTKIAGWPINNGNRRRRIMMNLFKKKKPYFTPTKLTTIYENLAY